MKWTLFYILSVCVLGSCRQTKTQKELREFMNSVVQIPPMQLVQNGELTALIERGHNIKLVVYYTSDKGCISCWISHLYDIERKFGAEINNIFTPVIVISIDDNNYMEVMNQLQSQPHTFPIYIDRKGAFRKTNIKLPKNYRYHTFLLDKHSRVVLVGNPLASDGMWTLFRSTLDNMLAHDGEYVPE